MKEIRVLIKINLVLVTLCVLILLSLQYFQQTVSFLAGVLVSSANFLILVYITKKLLDGKSLAIPLLLTVNKYILLFVGLYYVLRIQSISLPWVIFGLMILFPSIIVYGFLILKNRSV